MVAYVENSARRETWAHYASRDGGNVAGSPKDALSVSETEPNPNSNSSSNPGGVWCPWEPDYSL